MAVDNIRMGGINSGFDTEAMIEQMMSSYQTKIDKQNKKLTSLKWQQEAYQDITKKLTTFQNKYFDILNRDTYLMSSSTFNKYKTDITSLTGANTAGLTVSTTGNSVVGSHKIKVSQTATASTVKGNAIVPDNFKLDADKALESVNYTDVTNDDGTTTRKYEFSLNVQVGSVTKTVNFAAEGLVADDGTVDMAAVKQNMMENLNTELQASFGYSGRKGDSATGAVDADNGNEWFLQVEDNGNGFEFVIGGNATISVSEGKGSFGLTELASKQTISMGSAVTGENTVSIEVDGKVKTVTFEGVSSTYYSTKDEKGNEAILAEYNKLKEAAYRKANNLSDTAAIDSKKLEDFDYSDLQAAKDKNTAALTAAANAAFKDEGVTFSISDATMTAKKNGSSADFAINAVDGGTLGLAKANVSNKITSKTTIEDMGIKAVDGKYTMKINGVEISVDEDATIDTLVEAVNKSDANVKMSYSALTNSFTLESKEMGGAGAIEIEGTDFTQALGLTDASGEEVSFTLGHNAIVEIDGQELYLNSNSYTLDGTTFSFNEDVALDETFTVGISKNYDDVKQVIKDFVNDYNTLIEEVYDYIGTKPKTDSKDNRYEPLTDAEKESMSEDEIKNWEEAAKVGLLYNDSTVSGIMSKLRTVLYNSVDVDGGKIGLYNIGIKTSDDYEDHGKLEIDEEAFNKMFEEHADDIVKLFTDPDQGIMKQMDSVIDSAVKSTGKAESRGSLIRKAGLESGATAIDNTIFKEMERVRDRIYDLQDRYSAREEYWWSVFTNLESMMSDLNSQSGYIASYLGQ